MLKRICDICNKEIEGLTYYRLILSTDSMYDSAETEREHVCIDCAEYVIRCLSIKRQEVNQPIDTAVSEALCYSKGNT